MKADSVQLENNMIKLKDLLNEGKDKYEYGCVMLYSSFPTQIIKLQDVINPKDLYLADDNGGYGGCDDDYGLARSLLVMIINLSLIEIKNQVTVVETKSEENC